MKELNEKENDGEENLSYEEEDPVCPNCGQSTEGATTCPYCGAILSNDNELEDFEDEEF